MSTEPRLDIAEWLHTGATWQGTVPLAAFERFGPTVNSAGAVEVAVRFADDDQTRARVTGRCRVLAEVVCARCACEADVCVECSVDFRLVASEAQAEALNPIFDIVVTAEDRVSVATLVEDDLLLNLPDVGCADRDACANWAEQREAIAPTEPERRTGPFEVLGTMTVPVRKQKS